MTSRSAHWAREALRFARDNWRLVPLVLGVWLVWRGVSVWSAALASVVLGMGCIALAVMPYLRTRKDRS